MHGFNWYCSAPPLFKTAGGSVLALRLWDRKFKSRQSQNKILLQEKLDFLIIGLGIQSMIVSEEQLVDTIDENFVKTDGLHIL